MELRFRFRPFRQERVTGEVVTDSEFVSGMVLQPIEKVAWKLPNVVSLVGNPFVVLSFELCSPLTHVSVGTIS
ncbi:hypothetical protein C446_06935 [Halobiforma nitratireducens JCM 10879]|uniref:Uncharacterized protein n=1 Tax=Halobiforma nitratireducens JCM 10879 TaxID=1227454 RepID=M0M506_9EURY|nr:hypothetical protein C446_06935 [Halobiforma nitratireducens JCM 10879]